jgi:hypothetical protein
MSRHRLLLGGVLAMPLLLLVVIVSGEANRRLDRTEAVAVELEARAIEATPVLGPMLDLEGELLRERKVTIADARAGEDLEFRFRRAVWRWQFESMRRDDSSIVWTAEMIDLPARVFARGDGHLWARPLLPRRFAISRAVLSTLRRETLVEASLHRGASDSPWIAAAWVAGDPIGEVVGLLPRPAGGEPLAVVNETALIDPRIRRQGAGGSWLAEIAGAELRRRVELPSRAIAATLLADGAVAIASRSTSGSVTVRRVTLEEAGLEEPAGHLAPRSQLVSLEPDGRWWSLEDQPGTTSRVIRYRTMAGELLEEHTFEGLEVLALNGSSLLASFGPEIVLFRAREGRLVEAGRWQAPQRTAAQLASPELAVVTLPDRVVLLRSGAADPLFIVPLASKRQAAVAVDPSGASVVLQWSVREDDGEPSALLVEMDGSVVPLEAGVFRADHPLRRNPEVAPYQLLLDGEKLWLSYDGTILSYSRADGRLLRRVDRVAGSERRRIF